MSWVLGPAYGDVIQRESDYGADSKFLNSVSVIVGRMLFPFRSVLSGSELNHVASEMARESLIEFRKFRREESPEMWVAVCVSMRHSLIGYLTQSNFLSSNYAAKADVIGDSLKVLAESGGFSMSRLVAHFNELNPSTLEYLVQLSAEVDFIKLVKGIRTSFCGEGHSGELEKGLSGLADKQIQFISYVLEHGYTCRCAGRALGLTTFQISRLLRGATKRILSD
ncbi:hypothetical protein F7U66_00835 [Vibrio parahaemolyticus]|nr:hypothetical protein [Vibrio parahaemolyticus]